LGWLYGWFLLRGVRNEYAAGDLGPTPPGLLLLLILITFVTIGTALAAGIRVPFWPWMAMGSAVLIVAGILLAQYFPLHDYSARHGGFAVGLGDVVTVALRNRTPAGIIVSTGIPMLLLLSGLSGLMLRRVPPHRPPVRPAPIRPPGSFGAGGPSDPPGRSGPSGPGGTTG
jgi:hypothetical protein